MRWGVGFWFVCFVFPSCVLLPSDLIHVLLVFCRIQVVFPKLTSHISLLEMLQKYPVFASRFLLLCMDGEEMPGSDKAGQSSQLSSWQVKPQTPDSGMSQTVPLSSTLCLFWSEIHQNCFSKVTGGLFLRRRRNANRFQSQKNRFRNKHTVHVKLYSPSWKTFSVTRKFGLRAILHVSIDFSLDENLR